jgi:hypothetical protein
MKCPMEEVSASASERVLLRLSWLGGGAEVEVGNEG